MEGRGEKPGEQERDKGDEHEAQGESHATVIKSSRRQLRAKVMRTVNRIQDGMLQKITVKRLKKEMSELNKDITRACELHNELYEYVDKSEFQRMDQWEAKILDIKFSLEDEVDEYMENYKDSTDTPADKHTAAISHRPVTRSMTAATGADVSNRAHEQSQFEQKQTDQMHRQNRPSSPTDSSSSGQTDGSASQQNELGESFDKWIDGLIEFKETELTKPMQDLSIADVLYRLEASKDVPKVELIRFDGNPLKYVDFLETFKIHVHDKGHLTDDMRMVQLKMHVSGDAERAISGLGSGGVMYATALKIIKEQFGQKSVIARACINKLIKGQKITANNRQAVRSLSHDIVNCIAILRRINFFSDANSTESLRQVVTRLPDFLITRWKVKVTEIRDRDEVPTLEHINVFLRKQVRSMFDPDFGDIEVGRKTEYRGNPYKEQRQGVHAAQHASNDYKEGKKSLKCYVCGSDHKVTECKAFSSFSVDERIEKVKLNRLCFSCLNKNHISRECRSKRVCGINGCQKIHHQLLHKDPPKDPPIASSATPSERDGILPVVRARFRAPNGRFREGNILIDSGAGMTVIRKDFARTLGLQCPRQDLKLAVVGGQKLHQSDSRRVKFWVSALDSAEEFPVEAHEIHETILKIPPLNRSWLSSFKHLDDINLSHEAGPVDVILGVQYSHLHAEKEIRQGLPFEPVGKKTKLGWFVIGPDKDSTAAMCSMNFVDKVDMSQFYEFETIGIRAPNCNCPTSIMSVEDQKAMDLFESTCHKEGNRYVIGLPWKKDPHLLPDNYVLAEKRLESLEKSLQKNPKKAEMYKEALDQYRENEWAVPVTAEEMKSNVKPLYYLPHHGVYRPDKLSTPLRVVFDPACTFGGISLNSFLLKGPNLIGDLWEVLLSFREGKVAFIGDISKMFLQIALTLEDSQVHRFLWRDLDITKEPMVYRLTRVTFGDKPSPEMASFVMLKIAQEYQDKYTDAATILRRDRYVDDLIHSCESPEEARTRMRQLDEMLESGSFKINKWFCSAREALQNVEEENNEEVDFEVKSSAPVSLDSSQNLKALGVTWDPTSDSIQFEVKDLDTTVLTKRVILSWMSTLYDPLGLASVVTVKCRIAMQEIWKLKLEWDDPLPEHLCRVWRTLFEDLRKLETVQITRSLKPRIVNGTPELHVFADASIVAYGAVAYLLWPTEEIPSVRLVSSKVRVAPLRQTTIPRLELMAMLIASRLAKSISNAFVTTPTVSLWTDSQIVLCWLKSDSVSLKPFVGVRVAEIQSTWDEAHWKYVPTALNPADDLSRGLDVDNISRWIDGPAFPRDSKDKWPEQPSITEPANAEDCEHKKPKLVLTATKSDCIIDCCKFSSWLKLVRVTAYCKRFIDNLRAKVNKSSRCVGPLQSSEMTEAEEYWFQHAQREDPDLETKCRNMVPFQQIGILYVGGRLGRSALPYEQVHPVLLPGSSHISELIVRDMHNKMGHPGCERTLCQCRRRFWITKGRNLVRKVVKNCVVCRKLRQPAHSTLMAELPPERLRVFSPVFSTTGIDLFGPFSLKYGRNKTSKAWGAIFTCATVRAVHLEIVDSLSTEAFLQALRRFVAQHGWPTTILSDNGTSFVGTCAELKRLVEDGRKDLEEFAMLHKVNWKFITPLSPHQGGFYESLIKQCKCAIHIAVGGQTLTWNEMSTVFTEVKCLVNCRPMGYSSNDPNDLQPLTPNHFLLGRASVEIPQGPFQPTKNLHKRFAFVQSLVHHFWKRFVQEYLPTLMQRSKWILKGRQLQVGDIVLLTDPNVSRGKWNLGRITKVFPGQDDIVRNVEVKTKTGLYRRSIQRCCPVMEAHHDQTSLVAPEDVLNP